MSNLPADHCIENAEPVGHRATRALAIAEGTGLLHVFDLSGPDGAADGLEPYGHQCGVITGTPCLWSRDHGSTWLGTDFHFLLLPDLRAEVSAA